MKLLMLAPQPFFTERGVPMSVYQQLRALSHLEHTVDVLTYPQGRDIALSGVRIVRIPGVWGIRQVGIGASFAKLLLDIQLFFRARRMMQTGNYDCVIAHEEAAYLAIRLKKQFHTPVIYVMHSKLSQHMRNNACLRRVFEWLDLKAIHAADAVVTICPALTRLVTELRPNVPVATLENVCSFEELVRVTSTLDAPLPDLKGKKVVLYTGNFEPYQGVSLLLEAARTVFSQHHDACFVLVGGEKKSVQRYERAALRMGIGDKVICTGSVPFSAAWALIRQADVLVCPRLPGINTPLKIYSYVWSGKPIVATDIHAHRQILDEHTAVLTAVTAPALAQGIHRVLNDAILRSTLTENTRDLARGLFSFEDYCGRWHAVMNRIENICV